MQYAKCARCGEEHPTRQMHYVNYLNKYVCVGCYTEDIRREEDYFDFCQSKESRYEYSNHREISSNLNNQKFYSK